MKGTDAFTAAIKRHLDNKAERDNLFAVVYAKENKSIDDCITYILTQVQKSGCNGFDDDEIYSMAAHYYDEDDVKVGTRPNASIVVNHVIELTEEEKSDAKKEALEKAKQEQYKAITKRPTHKPTGSITQPTLFDL